MTFYAALKKRGVRLIVIELFGYRFSASDHRPLFSERNGYRHVTRYFGWSFSFMKMGKVLLLSILLLASSVSAESYEQKAKQIEQELDEHIAEGQKHVDNFDSVVLPWLDEQDRKRRERYCQSACNPDPNLNGNGISMCSKYCMYDVNGKYLYPRETR